MSRLSTPTATGRRRVASGIKRFGNHNTPSLANPGAKTKFSEIQKYLTNTDMYFHSLNPYLKIQCKNTAITSNGWPAKSSVFGSLEKF